MQRKTIMDDLKSQYKEDLDPNILEVNILVENERVYLELVKTNGGNDLIVYKYSLENWDTGPTYTAEELGISSSEIEDIKADFVDEPHLLLPNFDPDNDIDVSVAQFLDIFVMKRETLMALTDLFFLDDDEK